MDEQRQPPHEPLRLPTPPKASPASRHSYLDTVLSTPREQAEQARPAETSTAPAVPVLLPDGPAVLMSLGNATNETLVTPAKLGRAKATDKEIPPKPTSPRNGNLRQSQDFLSGAFCIDCNNCGKSIPDEHYHCGICDEGDFDLCSSCIAADVTCDGEGHWLIKRRIQNGLLVNSVTETIAPKKWQEEKFTEDNKGNMKATHYAPRTCNSCINGKVTEADCLGPFTDFLLEVPGHELVTCTNCADYDLCMVCFSLGDHGHHPGHRFQPVSADTSKISSRILGLCDAGRGLAHAAICDGCDKVRQVLNSPPPPPGSLAD
jgi:next to BRCA1 gene 1 protein